MLVALACTTPPSADPAAPGATDRAARDVPEPALAAAEVEERLSTALAGGLPTVDVLDLHFREVMSHGDSACPGDSYGFEILQPGGCVSTDGYAYSGAGRGSGNWEGEDYLYHLRADMVITDADGFPFEIGGDTTGNGAKDDVSLHFMQEYLGTFHYEPAGGWLGDGVSSVSWIELTDNPVERVLTVSGGFGLGGEEVYFDGLTVTTDCPATGSLLLREGGYWYTLRFSDGCDACGEIAWEDGSALGTACLDTAALATGVYARASAWLDDHAGER